MKTDFRQARPEDRARVTQFLKDIFHATGAEPALDPRQMRWKYEEEPSATPHAWTCRNFLLERDGVILAHAGVWPARMILEGKQYPGARLIDWAADPNAPGAGVSLLQKIAREEKIIYGLGGTQMTRKIFPALGFRPLSNIGYYARPLRPVRQILTHPRRLHWKAPARFLRNSWWSRSPRISVGAWSAHPTAPDAHTVWPSSESSTIAVFHRNAGGFAYLSRCPVIRSAFYQVRNNSVPAGYFLLVYVPGQARIADAWIPDRDPLSWQKLFTLAEREARKDPDVAELTSIAGLAPARQALLACGFQTVKEEQLMVYDPKRLLPPALAETNFQLVDDDACYLHENRPAYQT